MFEIKRLYSFISYKFLIIFISFFIGFIQPGIFSRYYDSNTFAALLLISGFLTYLAFLDMGFGKPLYSLMRENYVKKSNELNDVISFSIFFYIIIGIIILITTFGISFLIFEYFKPDLSPHSFILFSLALSSNIITNNFRHIFQAIDKYVFYEKTLFFKRLINMILLIIIIVQRDLTFFAFSLLIYNFFLLMFYVRRLLNQNKISHNYLLNFDNNITIFNKVRSSALDFFVITVCEVIFYNYGFFYLPYFNFAEIDIITYSIFNKIYLSIVLFVRIPTDISIHVASDYFHKSNFLSYRMTFYKTIFIAIPLAIIFSLPIIFFDDFLIKFWVGENYFNTEVKIALIIAVLANIIHHVCGTYLFSIGNNYRTCLKINLFAIFLIVFFLYLSILNQYSIENLLIGISFIYLIVSIIYYINFRRLLWR